MRLKFCIISFELKMTGECVKSNNLTAEKTQEIIVFYLTEISDGTLYLIEIKK